MPVDWVKPLKVEVAQDMGFPTEMNPSEDGLYGAGVAFEGSDMYIIRDNDEMLLMDPSTGSKLITEFTHNIINITANYTASGSSVVLCNASTNFTVSLPDATTVPDKTYNIKRIDNNAAYTTTIDPFSTQTIDGDLTIGIRRKESVMIISDGNNWQVL